MRRLGCLLLLLLSWLPVLAQEADPAVLPPTATIYHLTEAYSWNTNSYIVAGPTGQALIIDAADDLPALPQDADKQPWEVGYYTTGRSVRVIEAALKRLNLTLKLMIATHGHMDHVSGLPALKARTGAQVLVGEGDVRADGRPKDHDRIRGGLPLVDRVLKDDDLITLDGMTLRVIATPGHSPGSICLFTRQNGKPILFSGDTLLYRAIGPWVFHDGSGDKDLLVRSVREKLFTLPANTIVFPGHSRWTTIGEEKRLNRFLGTDVTPPEGFLEDGKAG